jgi:uncharacterized membrane protein HdeD (DUF308 family)
MRTLTIVSGVLMLACGVFCFVNTGQTFLNLAFVIGIVMVINGVIHTLAYLVGRGLHNKGDNNGWILVDALITLVLGILVLCNQLVVEVAIPMVFGMWVLVSGILRIEAASRINRDKKRTNFRSTLVTGILTVIVGVFGFINPIMAWVSVVFLLGIFLCMQGINVIELGVNMPHEKRDYVRIYKRRRDPVKISGEDETPKAVAERLEAREDEQKKAETIAENLETIGAVVDESKL